MCIRDSRNNQYSKKHSRSHTLELLAYGYLEGKDSEKAIAPLSKALKLGDDEGRYMRLANVYLQIDDYPNSAIAIEKALEKGDIDRPASPELYKVNHTWL